MFEQKELSLCVIDQSMADVSGLLPLLWDHHHQDDSDLGHIQPTVRIQGSKLLCSACST